MSPLDMPSLYAFVYVLGGLLLASVVHGITVDRAPEVRRNRPVYCACMFGVFAVIWWFALIPVLLSLAFDSDTRFSGFKFPFINDRPATSDLRPEDNVVPLESTRKAA